MRKGFHVYLRTYFQKQLKTNLIMKKLLVPTDFSEKAENALKLSRSQKNATVKFFCSIPLSCLYNMPQREKTAVSRSHFFT